METASRCQQLGIVTLRLDQVTRENVGETRLVWSRTLMAGTQEVTPLAYNGTLYMPLKR